MINFHDTMKQMQDSGVDRDYASGWMSGYLHHRKREEQNRNNEWEAGYRDGQAQDASHIQEHTHH